MTKTNTQIRMEQFDYRQLENICSTQMMKIQQLLGEIEELKRENERLKKRCGANG